MPLAFTSKIEISESNKPYFLNKIESVNLLARVDMNIERNIIKYSKVFKSTQSVQMYSKISKSTQNT